VSNRNGRFLLGTEVRPGRLQVNEHGINRKHRGHIDQHRAD